MRLVRSFWFFSLVSLLSLALATARTSMAQSDCSFSLEPHETTVAAQGTASFTFAVDVQPECTWESRSEEEWIQILAGFSGKGPGQVTIGVSANPGAARSGLVTVGPVQFVVAQPQAPCPEIRISPSTLPGMRAGQPFELLLTVTGGTGPYYWEVSDGFPGGLDFVGDGWILGTPSEPGLYDFVVQVTDELQCQGHIRFSGTVGPCVAPAVPAFTLIPAAVAAGANFTVSFSPTLENDPGGLYVVEVSTSANCDEPDTLWTDQPWAMLYSDAGQDATFCVRVQAISSGDCASEFSPPARISVKAVPAAFAVVDAPEGLTADAGGDPPADVSVWVRNIGDKAGRLTLEARGGLFEPVPASFEEVPGNEDVQLRLEYGRDVTATAGAKTGELVGTWTENGVQKSFILPVIVTVLPPWDGESKGSALEIAETDQFTFRHSGTGNPAPQTFTLVNTGDQPVRIAPQIGPGGAWLSVAGDFATPVPGGGSREFTLSVDRSRRSAEDGEPPLSTGLLIFNVDGNPEDAAYADVIDDEPPVAGGGAGREELKKGEFSLILGSAVSAGGLGGTRYLSDGWIRNNGLDGVDVDFYWTPNGADGLTDTSVRKSSVELGPYTTYRLADLVGSLFQVEGLSGQVEIRSKKLGQLSVRSTADSITAKENVIARYGSEIPIVVSGQGVKKGRTEPGKPGVRATTQDALAVLTGLRDPGAGFRTNLILAETTGQPATVSVKLFDRDGKKAGQKTGVLVPAYSKIQINSGDTALFPEGVRFDGGTVEVTPEAGEGAVAVFATIIDNKSGSYATRGGEIFLASETGRLVAKAAPHAASEPAFLPAATRSAAANNSFYTTRLVLTNLSRTAVPMTLTYLADRRFGAEPVVKTVPVPARAEGPRSVVFEDVVTELFVVNQDTSGMIKFEGNLAPLSIASETSTPIQIGSPDIGKSVSAVNPSPGKPENEAYGVFTKSASEVIGSQASGALQRVVTHPAIEEGFATRTNLILAEVAGEPCEVRVRLSRSGSNGASLGERTYPLQAFERLQINRVIRDVLRIESPTVEFRDIEIQVEALSGKGRLLAIVTKIDNNPASKRADIFTLGGSVAGAPVGFGN